MTETPRVKPRINRRPILFSNDTVIMLQIFNKKGHFDDLWQIDIEDLYDEHYDLYSQSAKELISQLEGQDCALFLQHLMRECRRELQRRQEKYGTILTRLKDDEDEKFPTYREIS